MADFQTFYTVQCKMSRVLLTFLRGLGLILKFSPFGNDREQGR